ncbi:hypothetical protein R3P38DRAFT_2763604 [Favolaschia claudopus]|uniref:Uncharacterized protein n=1 Tax=Favolaschia claudopus TaxID=2862362 RepID=A0AAW0DHS8_9AGAR
MAHKLSLPPSVLSEEELFLDGIKDQTSWDEAVRVWERRQKAKALAGGVLQCGLLLRFTAPAFDVTRFADMLHELHLEIPKYANVPSLIALGRTSKEYFRECMSYLDRILQDVFRRIGLHWEHFRFALDHSDSLITGLITGFFLLELLRLTYEDHGSISAKVKRMDIFTRGPKLGDLHDYLVSRTDYTNVKNTARKPTSPIKRTRWYKREGDPLEIAVHVYRDLTMNSLAMLSHEMVPLATKKEQDEVEKLEAQLADHGVKIATFHCDGIRFCGTSACCPSVIRNSSDAASLYALLPGLVPRMGRKRYCVIWALGAKDCLVPLPGWMLRLKGIVGRGGEIENGFNQFSGEHRVDAQADVVGTSSHQELVASLHLLNGQSAENIDCETQPAWKQQELASGLDARDFEGVTALWRSNLGISCLTGWNVLLKATSHFGVFDGFMVISSIVVGKRVIVFRREPVRDGAAVLGGADAGMLCLADFIAGGCDSVETTSSDTLVLVLSSEGFLYVYGGTKREAKSVFLVGQVSPITKLGYLCASDTRTETLREDAGALRALQGRLSLWPTLFRAGSVGGGIVCCQGKGPKGPVGLGRVCVRGKAIGRGGLGVERVHGDDQGERTLAGSI